MYFLILGAFAFNLSEGHSQRVRAESFTHRLASEPSSRPDNYEPLSELYTRPESSVPGYNLLEILPTVSGIDITRQRHSESILCQNYILWLIHTVQHTYTTGIINTSIFSTLEYNLSGFQIFLAFIITIFLTVLEFYIHVHCTSTY